jgi:hypothetical protein
MRRTPTLLTLALLIASAAGARADRDNGADIIQRQAVTWFKAINSGGPDGRMVPGVSRHIQEILGEGYHFTITVPAGLSKTGKAYYGLSWAGLFHVFELTPQEAQRLGVQGDTVTTGYGTKRQDPRRAHPLAQLDRPRIDNQSRLTGDQDITGSVVCQFFEEPLEKLVLRLSYKLKGSTVVVTKPLKGAPDDGLLGFAVSAINRDRKDPHDGPLALFIDVCVDKGGGFDQKLEVVSNTLGVLVDVRGRAPSSGLEGTVWQFDGTETTVQFLGGGKVLFRNKKQNSESTGSWQQTGRSVKFDSNGYTLFELDIDGDRMTGTWKRLKGEDVGQKYPSSMKRISSRPE